MSGLLWVRTYVFPPSEPGKVDTGLRFTDVLFGFVIKELFVRLQNWTQLTWFVRWQLVVGTVLVLGSWIGFRRSLKRAKYELKFFNLPLVQFLLDQFMVLLYFRIAIQTPTDPTVSVDAANVVVQTATTLAFIFGAYLVWDLVAGWTARVKDPVGPWEYKYPKIDEQKKEKTNTQADRTWTRAGITLAAFAPLLGLAILVRHLDIGGHLAAWLFVATAIVLVLYRWLKELHTTWGERRANSPSPPTPPITAPEGEAPART